MTPMMRATVKKIMMSTVKFQVKFMHRGRDVPCCDVRGASVRPLPKVGYLNACNASLKCASSLRAFDGSWRIRVWHPIGVMKVYSMLARRLAIPIAYVCYIPGDTDRPSIHKA